MAAEARADIPEVDSKVVVAVPAVKVPDLVKGVADEVMRFRKYFAIEVLTGPMLFSWKLKSFEPSLERVSQWHFLKRFFYYLSARLFGIFYNKRSMIIRPIDSFATKAPIEIRFRDRAELLIR